MAKYDIIEMPKMHGAVETILYPKLKHVRMMEDDEFIRRMASMPGGTTAAMAENVLAATADMLASLLSEGYSVRLKGIGTFKASLGMKRNKEYESEEEKRNARSIKVSKINFVADKRLIDKTDRSCYLERNEVQHITRIESTEAERLAAALEFLESHSFMKLYDYIALTGLTRTKASIELRKFRNTEGSGITSKGSGSHLIYVKGNTKGKED